MYMDGRGMTSKSKTTALVYYTAIIAFVMGWFFVGVGFFLPPMGEVSDSALWILGQSLLYTAAALGIGGYVHNEVGTLRRMVEKRERDGGDYEDNTAY